MIYLDNGATTKPYQEVLDSFVQVSEKYFANPSSIHELGGTVAALQTRARQQAADLLNISPEEVLFTSGGTEGNNLAVKGTALQHKNRGNHIITTEIEHPSIYESVKSLERLGFTVTFLPVDKYGVVDVRTIKEAITDETILVSIMHVNNEIGTIQPIESIGDLLKDYPKIYFHVDGVQGLGKVPLNLKDVDLCTFSGHKIHGLKGTGMLYVKKGTNLFPLFHGGEQEHGLRSGTENVAGNVSFAKALRLIKEQESVHIAKLRNLREEMLEELHKLSSVKVNSPKEGAPHIVHVSVPGIKPEVVIHAMYERGVVISTQSACSSKKMETSRVLTACGHDDTRASSGLRITLSHETTRAEVKAFLQHFKAVVGRLKNVLE